MSRLVGQQAEDSACAYLIKQGLQFVTRNFNCRLGEIDLIFKDGDELVFVEVKLIILKKPRIEPVCEIRLQ